MTEIMATVGLDFGRLIWVMTEEDYARLYAICMEMSDCAKRGDVDAMLVLDGEAQAMYTRYGYVRGESDGR